ncbi:MAG: PTS sugar transporter subunit IIB [Deltaproteobacteria bacterium]|nr:PTS sugar transporter subunit IIB [Deltaproteobacteria bacterium]
MILLVRVDDRLLHGQVIGAWVPFLRANLLVVASDEAAGDAMRASVMSACGDEGLKVTVRTIKELSGGRGEEDFAAERGIVVVGDLRDAMRLYEGGFRFTSLNIGNVHHHNGSGRKVTSSVMLSGEDEDIIERLEGLGVGIDIRSLPSAEPAVYKKGHAS